MKRTGLALAMFLGALVPAGAAWAGETGKVAASPWELNASVTCTRSNGSTLKLRVLAQAMRDWLIRASDGSSLVAQDIRTIAVARTNKLPKRVQATIVFARGGTEVLELTPKPIVGTDANAQERTLVLGECKTVSIDAEQPLRQPKTGDSGQSKK